MEHTDNVLIDGDVLDAARELRQITQQEKNLETRKKELKAIIAAHLNAGERGVSPDGEILVSVRNPAARFDPDLAAQNLPKEVLSSITTVQVDAKLAKQVLAPALYDLCCKYGEPSVVAL